MRADAGGAEVIRIATGFTSVDQLVTRAGLLVDAESVFVATATSPPAGERRRFELVLADGKPALAGLGEVIGGAARVGLQTGVRLRIVELDEASRPVHARIVAAKPATLKAAGAPRLAPPPFRKPGEAPAEPGSVASVAAAIAASAPGAAELQPSAVAELAAAVAEPAPTPEPTPAPVVAATIRPAAEPTELIDDDLRPAGMRQLPPWMRSKRVQIAAAVIGGIFLVGIIAAFASDDPPAPRPQSTKAVASSLRGADGERKPSTQPTTTTTTTTTAAPTPDDPTAAAADDEAVADVDAGVEADPEEVVADDGEVTDDTAEPAPPAKKKRAERSSRRKRESPAKRTARRDPPAKKKQDVKKTSRQVRLSVRSEPSGASIKVNGASISGGIANVEAGSTVKVTATKRGYKRATKSVKVGKGTSVVIKLEKM
jgi:hypothetical protein